jgi:hypothetical protein
MNQINNSVLNLLNRLLQIIFQQFKPDPWFPASLSISASVNSRDNSISPNFMEIIVSFFPILFHGDFTATKPCFCNVTSFWFLRSIKVRF